MANSGPQLDKESKEKLVRSLEGGNLWGVIDAYKDYQDIRKLKIQKTGGTALHMAVSESDMWESDAVKMVSAAEIDVLEMGNWQGDTALHLAAKFGNTYLCKRIAEKKDAAGLTRVKNGSGETPLFSAVSRGNTQAFLYLHHFSKANNCSVYGSCTRDNGDTILHSAISAQFFHLALIIIKEYPELVRVLNNDKLSPLHLLANKPSVFRSGLQLSIINKLIYHCVRVRRLARCTCSKAPNPEPQPGWKSAQSKIIKNMKSQKFVLKNQHEATNTRGHGEIVQQDEEAAHEQVDRKEKATNKRDSVDWMGRTVDYMRWIPFILSLAIVSILVVTSFPLVCVCIAFGLLLKLAAYILEYERVKRIKRRCIWSEEVMRELIEIEARNNKEEGKPDINEGSTSSAEVMNTVNPCTVYAEQIPPPKQEVKPTCSTEVMNKVYIPINPLTICAGQIPTPKQEVKPPDTPLLIAAKNGISEMVSGILEANPDTIHDVNAKEKNIVMLAVEHRHPRLYDYLWENYHYKKTIFEKVDTSGNSLLHLAADLESGKQFWRIRGAALHMQMEIKWYKHIKKSMPAGFFFRHNNKKETAKEIFQRTHKCLIEEGRQWLISTSQSCSVVAALIATVAFATSTTVPGGLNQDTGLPTLVNNPVFIISASSSLIALSSSMISVVMFLSILTSSFKWKNFHKDLPKKLLLGLVTLLISIVSMCTSFWTGHYFVLKPELNQYAPLVYVLGFPVVAFIISKFPLDFKIVWTTLSKKPRK